MLLLHFVDFEETLEIDQSQQIQVVIENYIQEKKLPINTKYHMFDEKQEIYINQILSDFYEVNKKIYILFILPHPVIIYFQEEEEQYEIVINLFDKIETLIQKLKQRFGLLGYTLELKYQNLDQNKSFYQIDQKVSKIQCKVTQKITAQYQNKEKEFNIDIFIKIQDLFKYFKEQFKIQQNFQIFYNDCEIKQDKENTQSNLMWYQIPAGAELIIKDVKMIILQVKNEVINEIQKLALNYNITVIEVIQQIIKYSKLQNSDTYLLFMQNTQLRNNEQIHKYVGDSNQMNVTFKQKIYDVEFYLCQYGIDFSKIKLRMKSNEKLINVCQQSYFRNKKIIFFYQNKEIDPNSTLQELKIIDQTSVQYQEAIEVIPIQKPNIVITEIKLKELKFQFNGQRKEKQFPENKFFSDVKLEILQLFGINQNFDQYNCSCQNIQIIESQTLEMIDYKQNDVIEIYTQQELNNEVEQEDEEMITIIFENEITQEKRKEKVNSNDQILDIKERLNLKNYVLRFNKKTLEDDIIFGERGIKNNSTVHYSEKKR